MPQEWAMETYRENNGRRSELKKYRFPSSHRFPSSLGLWNIMEVATFSFNRETKGEKVGH